MTHLEFIKLAITKGRDPAHPEYKGLHAVYSGFNGAFRKVFPKDDPIAVVNKLSGKHLVDGRWVRDPEVTAQIVAVPCKGGVRLYLPEEAPASSGNNAGADDLLAAMGINAEAKGKGK